MSGFEEAMDNKPPYSARIQVASSRKWDSTLESKGRVKKKSMDTISRGGRGEISSEMRPWTVWNLVAQVRDTHFTVVPYVVMPTEMHQNRNISQVLPLFYFKGKSAFYGLIYHSRLSKPPSFVMQWNADMHFFCLNPHLTGSPAGRCYWQLSEKIHRVKSRSLWRQWELCHGLQ